MRSRVAIIGSRELACSITEWIASIQKVEIIGCIAPPFKGWWDDKFLLLLQELKIPVYDDLDKLLDEKPDIIFSINYWKKILPNQINKVPKGIVNIHHSYLLKFKGRYSTSWAIMHARRDNCWEHGTTLHYINEELDEGPIIDSWKCNIEENDTGYSLFQKVEKLAFEMFKFNFDTLINGCIEFLEPSQTTFFYDKESNNVMEITKDLTLIEIYDLVRAWTFHNRPTPFIHVNGRKIYLNLEE